MTGKPGKHGTKKDLASEGNATGQTVGEAPLADGEPDSETTPELQHAFDAGRDAAINGPNTINCNFSIFYSPEMTKAWQRGTAVGRAALAKARGESK